MKKIELIAIMILMIAAAGMWAWTSRMISEAQATSVANDS
jgi:hypothetical protein